MSGTVIGKSLNYGYPGSVSRGADAIIMNRPVRSTDPNAVPFGGAVVLNTDNTYSLFGSTSTTLTTALVSATAYTSLAVQALSAPVQIGDSIIIGTGATTQTVTASANAAVGATSISVNSFTANAAYAVGTAVLATNTFAQFAGVAVREVKQSTSWQLIGQGQAQYNPGDPCDVLERGAVTVLCNVGTPTAGGAVYLRVATNAAIPSGVVGGFEAAADGNNTVQITNAMWKTGKIDANNVAELSLLVRNKG